MASRVDPAAMKLLTDNIPARKSRATVTTPVTMPARSSVGMGHQEESLHHMLGQMLLNRCIDPNRCTDPIPGLKVFDAPRKAAHGSKPAPLAIEDNKLTETATDEAAAADDAAGPAAGSAVGPAMSVDDMAKDLLHKLGKGKLEKPRAKGVLKRPAAMTPVKIKTAADAEGDLETPAKRAKVLAFPGVDRTPPVCLEKATIYTTNHSWRVQQKGEQKDKAFSFKIRDPKMVWAQLVEYVEGL